MWYQPTLWGIGKRKIQAVVHLEGRFEVGELNVVGEVSVFDEVSVVG